MTPRTNNNTARRNASGVLAPVTILLCAAPVAAQEVVRISGTGSGTGGLQLLADAFMREVPNVKVQVLPAIGNSGGTRH